MVKTWCQTNSRHYKTLPDQIMTIVIKIVKSKYCIRFLLPLFLWFTLCCQQDYPAKGEMLPPFHKWANPNISSQLRCLNGVLPSWNTEDLEKYCFTDISQNFFDSFPPWTRRNQCYILGLLCGYVLHITKGRKIKIPPVVNLLLWQFVLALFFAVMYGPYNTELETGIDTPLQRSILN